MVRIRSHNGEIVGSGFLVGAGHVVTCAHVVTRALGRKTQQTPAETDTVSLDFPLVAAGVMVGARVEVWHPIQDDDKGDIAVLALISDPPAGVLPASLVAAEDFWSHPFRAFGFPRHHDHGVWASGVLRARQAAGWVQMESGPSGYPVEAGFSGAAVWDDEVAGVVGMTVAADARGDLRAAYLIPTEELIRAWPPLAGRTVPPCPYRGLHAFRERDVSVFHGRQDLTDRLATEVRRRPLVAVVGPSGSGKSSVVFAGLLPRLSRNEGWLGISMRPAHASSPLVALAAAFLPFLEPDQAETERLTALGQLTTVLRGGHLPDVLDRVLTRAGKTDALLVVDQFEELFAREGVGASEFIGVLLPALQAPVGLTVVLTLRADFLGQALQDPVLAAALEGAVTTIGQMGREQLRAVIEGPLPKGVRYEAGLVERILGDVGEAPGSLPLLEFALTLLWERQDRGTLTHLAYEQLGGVSGALASYAERVYVDQLLPADQEEARRLLIQLVRPSEVGEPVRRIARRPELGEPRWQLGQRLAATRLLVTDRDPTGVESVELVHEALIGGWSRLYDWFDEDRAFRTWQEQVRGSLAQWETARRNEGALLRGAPLAEAERWLAERPDDLGAPERQFIQASRALRTRSVRRLRVVAAVLALLLLVASSLGGAALWYAKRADKESKLAQSRELATQANLLVDSQPDVAMLLAATAYKIADTEEATETLTRMASQWQHADRLITTGMRDVSQIAFNPKDSTMVALTNANSIELWDVKKNILITRRPEGGVSSAFSPDGNVLAYLRKTEQGAKVVLWSHADNGVRKIPLNLAPDEGFGRLAFSSNGKFLGACAGRRIELWSLEPGGPRHSIPLIHGTRCAFGFRGESGELAYIDGDDIVTWDIDAGRVVTRRSPGQPKSRRPGLLVGTEDGWFVQKRSFFFQGDPTFAVAPNGRSAIYSADGPGADNFKWWDFDHQEARDFEVEPDIIPAVPSFTSNGSLVAAEVTGGIVFYDVARRVPISVYSLRNREVAGGVSVSRFSLSSDGNMIASVDHGGVIALIDTRLHRGIPVYEASDEVIWESSGEEIRVAVQPDDDHLIVASADKVAIYSIKSLNSGPVIVRSPVNDESGVNRFYDLSRNGLRYASVDAKRKKIHLLDVSSLPVSDVTIEGGRGDVLQLSFDRGGDFLACADKSEIIVWSTKRRAEVSRIPLPEGYTTRELVVSPGGRYIAASGSDGKILLWDTNSSDRIGLDLLRSEDEQSMAFSPDGKWLSIGGRDEIRFWDLGAGKFDSRRIPIGGVRMEFGLDGSLLAIQNKQDSYDRYREISVWDVRDVVLRGTVSEPWSLRDFAFTSDKSRLAVSGSGVFVEPFDGSWALKHVCDIVRRNLRSDEWKKYQAGSDYVHTCLP
ncbi:MAG: trypsin-like peptidase domain-containing protein [Pseudonocardiaceae bacterium]